MTVRKWWAAWRIWSAASPNRRIFSGAMTIGVITVGAKLLALAKELAIAAWFGRSDQLEVFLLAALLPQMLGSMLGGSFAGAVLPALARAEQVGGRAASDRLFAGLLGVALPLLIVLAVLMAVAGGMVVPLMAGGFAPEKLALTQALLPAAAPMAVLGALATMLCAPLHGRERFVVTTLSPALTPLMILVGITLFGAKAEVLVSATLAGQLLEVIVLAILLYVDRHRIWPNWPHLTTELRGVLSQWLPAIAATGIHGSTVLVDQVTAAHLPAGSVAAFTYAQRLVLVPLGLIIAVVGPAFLAVLARSHTEVPSAEVVRISDWWRRRMLWGLSLCAVVVMLLAPWLTALAFERGSFTAHDTAEVALAVATLAAVAPWYVVGTISVRLLNVLGGNRFLPAIASVNLGMSIAGNLVLAPLLGVLGIAITTVMVYLVSFLQIELHVRRLRRLAAAVKDVPKSALRGSDHSQPPTPASQ